MTTKKTTEFIFLFLLVFTFTFSLSLFSASPFGYDIDDTPGTYTYFVNNTYLSIANGTGTFVQIAGDTMTGSLNISGTGVSLLINQNVGAPISSIAGTAISARGADNALVRIAISSYGIGGVGAFANRHARGTAASPTAVSGGDTLFSLEGWGYGATAYSVSSRAMIRGYASQIWNDTNQPTYLSFWTSKNHTIAPIEQWRIHNDGSLTAGATGTSANQIVTAGNISANNMNLNGNFVALGNFSSKRPFYWGYDNSTQTFSNTANVQVINISNNNDIGSYQIAIQNKQNVTFQSTGEYLITLSPEFYQSGGAALITFWIQTTNSSGAFNDVAWSNSRYSMSNGAYNAPTIEYPITILTTSQKVRFMWWSDSVTSQIYSSGALTSPTRPSIPGILLNIRKSSALV